MLNWIPYGRNPAPALKLFTPIVPSSFSSIRCVTAIPLTLLALYAGDLIGQKLRVRSIRVIFNYGVLFTLTAVMDVLIFGEWASLKKLLA